jgi:hypothetical protein
VNSCSGQESSDTQVRETPPRQEAGWRMATPSVYLRMPIFDLLHTYLLTQVARVYEMQLGCLNSSSVMHTRKILLVAKRKNAGQNHTIRASSLVYAPSEFNARLNTLVLHTCISLQLILQMPSSGTHGRRSRTQDCGRHQRYMYSIALAKV